MKKVAALLVVLGIIAATAVAVWYYRIGPGSGVLGEPHMTEHITLRIGALSILAELADTPELRSVGLSNRDALEEGLGMWFVFGEDGYWQFWMKDTLIPLDIIWVDKDGTVVTIAHNVQPETFPDTFTSSKPARYVLEVPGGYAKKYQVTEGLKITW